MKTNRSGQKSGVSRWIVFPILILTAGVLIYYPLYLYPAFKETIILDSKDFSLLLSRHFIRSYQPGDSAQQATPADYEVSGEAIAIDADRFDIWKLRFFDAAGSIVYSTKRDEIGDVNRKEFFVNRVAKGEIVSKMEKKGGATFMGNVIVPYDVVETYVPIMKNGQFTGALEIYLNVTTQMNRLNTLFWRGYTVFCCIIFLLFLAIAVFLAKLNRSVKEKQELIDELQEALAKIQTLSGMIPICSSCKKIRDDSGFWNKIETYVNTQPDATFSHSYCPECYNDKMEEMGAWIDKNR